MSKKYVLQSLKKDLGEIINNDMKFKDQVASAAKKSNKIDELNTRSNETFPEIIAICETKLNDDIGNEAIMWTNVV